MFILIFCLATLLIVFLVEKATEFVVEHLFKQQLREIVRQEKKISEYYELSILAMAAKEKEALNGIQEMANEVYWKVFFRKLTVFSATFFLLLSPYMLISQKLFSKIIPSPFMAIFTLAISYFLCKTLGYYIIGVLKDRKIAKQHNK